MQFSFGLVKELRDKNNFRKMQNIEFENLNFYRNDYNNRLLAVNLCEVRSQKVKKVHRIERTHVKVETI